MIRFPTDFEILSGMIFDLYGLFAPHNRKQVS